MPTQRIITGDCRERLAELPKRSVHCCVTSPPYWGLRDYGVAGQLGLEAVPDCLGWATGAPCGACYVCHLVEVFRAVRRVLRDDGTVFLNLGDSYCGEGKRAPAGLKPKDLVGIPWRVALALQADGWTLRSEVIWAKKSCMPESVRDRPTRSHEQVFLLAKGPRYFYDAEAVREESTSPDQDAHNQRYAREYDFDLQKPGNGQPGNTNHAGLHSRPGPGGRNMRSVWHLGPSPFPSAHFATFVPEIPRRAIMAGTSERGCCPACGAGWVRVVERGEPQRIGGNAGVARAHSDGPMNRGGHGQWDEGHMPMVRPSTTTGWSPSCRCDAGTPVPAVVLDPFAGAGTTGLVADRLGRSSVLIELNPEYAAMARARIVGDAPLFANVAD